MSDPQKAILAMVAAGKINAEEAASLLAAVKPKEMPVELPPEVEPPPPPPKKVKLPKKIRITILQKDGRTMHATIPLGLLNFGMQFGNPLSPIISAENLAALTASTDTITIKMD